MYPNPGAQFVPTAQMPVNPMAPMWPWMGISLNNPPFVPLVQPIDPNLMPLVPVVAAVAAFEIQKAAQDPNTNPLRIFMYNMQAANQFRNQEFEAFVQACMDFLWCNLANQRYATAEQGAQDTTMKMIELARGMYVQRYPALEQTLTYDRNLITAARELSQQFQAVNSEIAMTKQRFGLGQQPVYGGYQAPAGYQNPGGYQAGGYPTPQRTWGASWQTQVSAAATGIGASAAGGFFNNRHGASATAAAAAPAGSSLHVGRYDQRQVNQPSFSSQAAPAPNGSATAGAATVPITDSLPTAGGGETKSSEGLLPLEKVTWIPSEDYPHPPAYNPELYVAFVRINEQGQMAPVIERKEDVVDFQAHALNTFGTKPKSLDLSKTADALERVQHGIEQINDQDSPVEGEQAAESVKFNELIRPEVDQDGKDVLLRELSPAAVWMMTALERLTTQVDGHIPDVFRSHAKLYEAVVGESNETGFVRSFAACESFIELREKLNNSVNKISAELWMVVNRRMTEVVNRALRQNLSLQTKIGNFVEDIEDLQKLLRSRYGDLVADALAKHEAELIQMTLGTFDDEEAAAELEPFLPPEGNFPEGVVPKATFVVSNASFTFLNCRSHELNIQLHKVGAAVTPGTAPLLFELLLGIFDAPSTKAFVEEHGKFATHLIRTVDGRVLEAQRGYIGAEYFTLTLVE